MLWALLFAAPSRDLRIIDLNLKPVFLQEGTFHTYRAL